MAIDLVQYIDAGRISTVSLFVYSRLLHRKAEANRLYLGCSERQAASSQGAYGGPLKDDIVSELDFVFFLFLFFSFLIDILGPPIAELGFLLFFLNNHHHAVIPVWDRTISPTILSPPFL